MGFLIDNFDIYLPLVALAPAITYFIPTTIDVTTAALTASWIFISTLVGRPLGALIFGTLADRIGRRRSTLIAVACFGVVTLMMAALPGYSTWGIGSIVALVSLRFLGGVFLGGEYSGANVLAMEESPRERRGFFGGLVQSGASAAYVVLTAMTLLLLAIIPAPQYLVWGWRIPFAIGGLLAFAFFAYYMREVRESKVWEKGAVTKFSALTLLRGANLKAFLQVFLMMTGMWLLLDSVTALIPPVLKAKAALTSSDDTLVVLAIWIASTFVYIGGASLSQRVGRKRYLIVSGVLALVVGVPAYWALINLDTTSVWAAMVPAVIAAVFVVSPWGVVTPYLAERFQTANRAVGFGLGYSLAVIIPSFYATYLIWLAPIVPAPYTVLILVGIGAVLAVIGAAAGPETKDIEFHASAPGEVKREVRESAKVAAPPATAA